MKMKVVRIEIIELFSENCYNLVFLITWQNMRNCLNVGNIYEKIYSNCQLIELCLPPLQLQLPPLQLQLHSQWDLWAKLIIFYAITRIKKEKFFPEIMAIIIEINRTNSRNPLKRSSFEKVEKTRLITNTSSLKS